MKVLVNEWVQLMGLEQVWQKRYSLQTETMKSLSNGNMHVIKPSAQIIKCYNRLKRIKTKYKCFGDLGIYWISYLGLGWKLYILLCPWCECAFHGRYLLGMGYYTRHGQWMCSWKVEFLKLFEQMLLLQIVHRIPFRLTIHVPEYLVYKYYLGEVFLRILFYLCNFLINYVW